MVGGGGGAGGFRRGDPGRYHGRARRSSDLVLKMLRACPKLCILVTSGYPVDMTAVEAAAASRTAFLQKPFSSEMLSSAVRRILGAQEESL